MSLKTKALCLLIILSRLVDLYTTGISLVDFEKQETNILVKIFNLSFFQFCFVDIFLSFLLIGIYVFSVKNNSLFEIKSSNIYSYSKLFLFKKDELTISDFLLKMSFKRCLILFGSITPLYIFVTSCVFSLNNIWVNLYVEQNKQAIKLYNFLNSYYFFDFIIFILPFLILLHLLYQKLKNEFYLYNEV